MLYTSCSLPIMATYRLPFQLYLQVYLSSLVQQIKVPVYANILMVFHYFKRNYIVSVPNKSTCFPFPPNYPLFSSHNLWLFAGDLHSLLSCFNFAVSTEKFLLLNFNIQIPLPWSFGNGWKGIFNFSWLKCSSFPPKI